MVGCQHATVRSCRPPQGKTDRRGLHAIIDPSFVGYLMGCFSISHRREHNTFVAHYPAVYGRRVSDLFKVGCLKLQRDYRGCRQLLRREYTDPLEIAMARGFVCFVALFLIENFGFDWFDDEFCQVLFALWAAVVWTPDNKLEKGSAEELKEDSEVVQNGIAPAVKISH